MNMKNWKTTVGGVIAAMPQILPVMGIVIPEPISKLVMAIGLCWFAYFAKDKNVTGGSVSQD